MTISTAYSPDSYTATAGQTDFAYTFRILANTDIDVYVNGTLQTLTTDYTVSGVGEATGGTVTFVSGLRLSDAVVLQRSTALTQAVDLAEGDDFPAETLETALDKLTMIGQEHGYYVEDLEAAVAAAEAAQGLAEQSAIDAAASAASIALPLPVASGGTASTTAADARTALGLALPLPIASGGTASTSASAARTALGLGTDAADAYKLLRAKSDGSGWEAVDLSALLGRSTSKSVAGSSNVNLTAAEAAAPVIILTGALTGNIDVTVPAAAGAWTVYNATTGDYAITFTPLGGTGVVLDNGERSVAMCFSDGSTMRELSKPTSVRGVGTRDMTLAGGSSTTISCGGRPRRIDIDANYDGGSVSFGVADASGLGCKYQSGPAADTWYDNASYVIFIDQGAGNAYAATFTINNDGFLLNWAKVSSSTGTMKYSYVVEMED